MLCQTQIIDIIDLSPFVRSGNLDRHLYAASANQVGKDRFVVLVCATIGDERAYAGQEMIVKHGPRKFIDIDGLQGTVVVKSLTLVGLQDHLVGQSLLGHDDCAVHMVLIRVDHGDIWMGLGKQIADQIDVEQEVPFQQQYVVVHLRMGEPERVDIVGLMKERIFDIGHVQLAVSCTGAMHDLVTAEANHDDAFLNADAVETVESVLQQRLPVDWHQALGHVSCQRPQPRTHTGG